MSEMDLIAPEVKDHVQMVQTSVKKAVGIEPDLTPETLPLIDHYLREIPLDSPFEVKELIIANVGCYFGEVVRRRLFGRWNIFGPSPFFWRIELYNCFLRFYPCGMVGEVLTAAVSDDYDGSFATIDELWDDLQMHLASASPVPEEEYFSLAGRMDILHLAADWLVGKAIASGNPLRRLSAKDYQLRFRS